MNFFLGFIIAAFSAMIFWLYGLGPLIFLFAGMFMGVLSTLAYLADELPDRRTNVHSQQDY